MGRKRVPRKRKAAGTKTGVAKGRKRMANRHELAPRSGGKIYRQIVENVREGIWTINAGGVTTFANEAMTTMLGYSVGEMLGRPFTDFMDAAAKGEAALALDRRKAGVREEMDFRFQHKDGHAVWTRLSTTPFLGDGERFGGALAMVTDISARRQAEQALREREAMLELVFNTTTDAQALIRVESDGRLVNEAVNSGYMAAARRLFPDASPDPVGRERTEFLMTTYGLSREVAEAELPRYREVIERQRAVRYSIPLPNAEGDRMLDVTLAPVIRDGRCTHLLYNARDVTERERAVRALRESEERLREAQRIGHLGSLDLDLATNTVLLSDETIAILGLSAEQKRPSLEELVRLLHPDDRDRVTKSLNDAVAGIAKHDIKHRMVRPDGSVVHVHAMAELLRTPDGTPVRLLGTVHDITDRIGAARALRESQERYALVERAVADGIWDWNILTGDDYLSPRWKALLGYRDEELPNVLGTFTELVHPQERAAVADAIARHLDGNERYDIEIRLRHKDGRYRWLRARGEALRDAAGKAVRMVGTISDITDRKHAEIMRQSQNELLTLLFRHSIDNIVLLDKDYNFIRVSDSYARECQMDAADLIGKNHFAVFPSPFEQELVPYRQAKQTYRRTERPFVFADHPEWGTSYWDLAMVPILDAAGEIEFFLFTLKNVTERKRAEEQTRRHLLEKETLLREIHHRVKNNLQVVAGLLHFQAKKLHAPEDAAAFAELRQRIFAMTLLHERLYQSSDVGQVAFGDYVRALVAEQLGASASHNGIRIDVVSNNVQLPMELAMPSGLIISELVTNVLKYAFPGTGRGIATVSVRSVGDRIVLGVDDDGVGFPDGFDPGSGGSFGWELVRTLARQIDGTAEATTNRGAHVRVSFPAPVVAVGALS